MEKLKFEEVKGMPMMARIAQAIAEVDNPVKDTKGFNYTYADLAQVNGLIKPVLAGKGIATRHYHTAEDDGREIAHLQAIDMETGETIELDSRWCLKTGDPQDAGSDETYKRRYSLLANFGLAPEDDDGARAHESAKGKADAGVAQARQALQGACVEYAARHSCAVPDAQNMALSMLGEGYGAGDMLRVAGELEQM